MTTDADAYREFMRSTVTGFSDAAGCERISLNALLPNTIFRSGEYYVEGETETSTVRADILTPQGALGSERMFLPVRSARMALIARNIFEKLGGQQTVSVVYVSDAILNTQVRLFLDTELHKPNFRKKIFICDPAPANVPHRERELQDVYEDWDSLCEKLQKHVAERRADGDFVILFLAVDRTLIFPMGPMDVEYNAFLDECLRDYLKSFLNPEYTLDKATPYNVSEMTEWIRNNYAPYSQTVSSYASDYDVLAFVLLCLCCGLCVRDEFVSRECNFRTTFRGEGSFVEAMNTRVKPTLWGLFEEPEILGPLNKIPSVVWNAEKLRVEFENYAHLIESHLAFNHLFRKIQNRKLCDCHQKDNSILNGVLIDAIRNICEKQENLFLLGMTDMPARAVGLQRTDEGTAIYLPHTDAAFMEPFNKE